MSTYRKPEYMQSLTVLAFRARLLRDLKADPLEFGIFWVFTWSAWCQKHLTADDHVTMGCIQTALGEEEAGRWMRGVLKQAGVFKDLPPDVEVV